METKQDKIINIISLYLRKIKQRDIDVKLDSKLSQDLNLDSLDAVELALYIKQEYQIDQFDIFEMMKSQLITVQDVINFFENLNDTVNQ